MQSFIESRRLARRGECESPYSTGSLSSADSADSADSIDSIDSIDSRDSFGTACRCFGCGKFVVDHDLRSIALCIVRCKAFMREQDETRYEQLWDQRHARHDVNFRALSMLRNGLDPEFRPQTMPWNMQPSERTADVLLCPGAEEKKKEVAGHYQRQAERRNKTLAVVFFVLPDRVALRLIVGGDVLPPQAPRTMEEWREWREFTAKRLPAQAPQAPCTRAELRELLSGSFTSARRGPR